jgi:uncharacterized membrane protein YgcG
MKSIIALFLLQSSVVNAGTNKTLAPTPGVRRPTPFPTGITLDPTFIDIIQTPAPTEGFETPAPQPNPRPEPTPKPVTPRPTPKPVAMSFEYVIDEFSSYKPGKDGSGGSSGGGSGKSGKGSGKSGKGSSGEDLLSSPYQCS